ncbi:hypothetical protein [Rhizobium leguminosarum]|jgi:hypothetical protein|uniref:hypothetical protein n=1 Tax=Rhizobium leguminosarum TaxID=384 RepID=UPI001030D906|nr:hypothetical protein [Rhizobium leguminosarum]TAX38536.1 hypothetical protein ELI05_06040 [Rhizobium leguminosarum]
MLAYEFTRWWAYRRIDDEKMRQYVWTVPLSLTAICFVIYYALPVRPGIIGSGGLFDKASLAFTLLPGFFISALAAVATFNRTEMDETMPAPAPKVEIRHRGKTIEIELTRRMFLSYLFSYLSMMSFCLFFAVNVFGIIRQNVEHWLLLLPWVEWRNSVMFLVDNAAMLVFVYFCASVIVTMLHGIYFLCERIHMPNS